jgi:TPR repeat protein
MSIQIKILRTSTLIATLAAAPLLLTLAPSAQAADPDPRAVALIQAGRAAEALQWLEQASDAGDDLSAEYAGLMYLHGPTLFGAQVPRDRQRAIVHLRRAAEVGSPVAREMLRRLGVEVEDTVVASIRGC